MLKRQKNTSWVNVQVPAALVTLNVMNSAYRYAAGPARSTVWLQTTGGVFGNTCHRFNAAFGQQVRRGGSRRQSFKGWIVRRTWQRFNLAQFRFRFFQFF